MQPLERWKVSNILVALGPKTVSGAALSTRRQYTDRACPRWILRWRFSGIGDTTGGYFEKFGRAQDTKPTQDRQFCRTGTVRRHGEFANHPPPRQVPRADRMVTGMLNRALELASLCDHLSGDKSASHVPLRMTYLVADLVGISQAACVKGFPRRLLGLHTTPRSDLGYHT